MSSYPYGWIHTHDSHYKHKSWSLWNPSDWTFNCGGYILHGRGAGKFGKNFCAYEIIEDYCHTAAPCLLNFFSLIYYPLSHNTACANFYLDWIKIFVCFQTGQMAATTISPVLVSILRSMEVVMALIVDIITRDNVVHLDDMRFWYKVIGSCTVTMSVISMSVADKIHQGLAACTRHNHHTKFLS